MLDDMGLIQMGGRLYDSRLGRFLQADPFVQESTNTQSFNRYAYVLNNPLNATDPSGYFWNKIWKELRPFVGAIVAIVVSVVCTTCGPMVAGMIGGAVGAAANGGDMFAIMSGMMFGVISGGIGGVGNWQGFLMRGAVGGMQAAMSGGRFGSGFLAAGIGGLATSSNPFTNFVQTTVLAGTASEITGGKFKNGAASAAFMWAVSSAAQKIGASPANPAPTVTNDKAAGDYTANDVVDIVKTTKTGKVIMDEVQPIVVMDSSKGAYYDGNTNTIHLNSKASLSVNVNTMGHELGHVMQNYLGINNPSARSLSREEYIDSYIANEVGADATRHTIYEELADKSLMLKPTRHDEWLGAPTLEDRMQLITNRFVGPNAIYRASVSGVPYEEVYGDYWDKVNK